MAFEIGDRVVAQHNTRRLTPGAVGALQKPRHGVIEEVLREEPNARYLIRWDVGKPSIFAPRDSGLRPETPGEQD
jgi:hypothetical protein